MLDERKKPEIITYNGTKSGVDVLEKLVRTYSCKRASSRWTVAFFLNMLDIVEYSVDYLWSKLAVRQATPQAIVFARVGYTTTPWSRVCTFQDTEIFGGYKTSAYRNAHVDQESSLQRLACLHHWVVWLTAKLFLGKNVNKTIILGIIFTLIDVDDATYAREKRAEDERMHHMSNTVPFCKQHSCVMTACLTCAEGGDERPRYQWMGGSRCDYCRGSEDCSDALMWNTIISVSQIKSIFAAIAVFSFYNVYISQYSRQRSFLWYKNTYVTCNTGCYIDVWIWVIFDPHA